MAALGKLGKPGAAIYGVIGGAKVSDKPAVLKNLLDRVDNLLIGGGMANTFLLAQGHSVGKSLAEPSMVEEATEILEKASKGGTKRPTPG